MAYSVEADIKKQLDPALLVQLADDDNDGVADSGVISQAIADADAELDSYLSGRYTVPLSPVPALVKKLSVDVAIWNLYSRRSTVEDEVRKSRYAAAVKLLTAISKGEARLGIDPEPTSEQDIQTTRVKTDRTFTIGQTSSGDAGSLDNY